MNRASKKTSYGIGELYGERFNAISNQRRVELLDVSPAPNCPHLESWPGLAPVDSKKAPKLKCSKSGGVCSIRNFSVGEEGQVFGPITATCPIRFYEGGKVFQTIGETLLGNPNAHIAKEIAFLKRPPTSNDTDDGGEDVGRIDMVMVDTDRDRLDWCAVELQAVYFSGGAMNKDYALIRSHSGNDVPMPGANRRPDFRSSGPKRLMPQLQIKVPTLRRWGKKMAIVVDRPFFDALGEMDKVGHVSNSDIVWFIVAFEEVPGESKAELVVDEIRYTTLERAVEGLTAGVPTTLPEFEDKIKDKLGL